VSAEHRIAELEAQVAELEATLHRRSRELRQLQRHLCPRDLTILARLAAGLPAIPPRRAFDLELWAEDHDLQAADVGETLREVWTSLAPVEEVHDGG